MQACAIVPQALSVSDGLITFISLFVTCSPVGWFRRMEYNWLPAWRVDFLGLFLYYLRSLAWTESRSLNPLCLSGLFKRDSYIGEVAASYQWLYTNKNHTLMKQEWILTGAAASSLSARPYSDLNKCRPINISRLGCSMNFILTTVSVVIGL